MEIAMAANFLAGSILMMLGLTVLIIGVVAINNILHKYWKPVKVAVFHSINSDEKPKQKTALAKSAG
jgi:hypothetical protein